MNKEIENSIDSYYDFWLGINALYENWAKKYGLTTNSLFALYVIHRYPHCCTQRFVCDKLLFPKQTVNTILDTFEAKGYITKQTNPNDRRSKQLLLTEQGQLYSDQILSDLLRFEADALAAMPTAQQTGLLDSSHAFLKQLQHALALQNTLYSDDDVTGKR